MSNILEEIAKRLNNANNTKKATTISGSSNPTELINNAINQQNNTKNTQVQTQKQTYNQNTSNAIQAMNDIVNKTPTKDMTNIGTGYSINPVEAAGKAVGNFTDKVVKASTVPVKWSYKADDYVVNKVNDTFGTNLKNPTGVALEYFNKARNAVSQYLVNNYNSDNIPQNHKDYFTKKYFDTTDVQKKVKNDNSYYNKLFNEDGSFVDYSSKQEELKEKMKNPYTRSQYKNEYDYVNSIVDDQNKVLYSAYYNQLKDNGATEEELNTLQKQVIRSEQNDDIVNRAATNFATTIEQYVGNKLAGADALEEKLYYELGIDYETNPMVDTILNDASQLQAEVMSSASGAENFIYQVYNGMSEFVYDMVLLSFASGANYVGNISEAKNLVDKSLLMSDISVLGSKYRENKQNGYDIETSFNNAFLYASINHLTEKIGGEALASVITGEVGEKLLENTWKYMVISLANVSFAEGIEEGMGALLEPIADIGTLGKSMTVDEYLTQVFSWDTGYQMLVGGLGGLAMGIGGSVSAVEQYQQKVDYIKSSFDIKDAKDYNTAKAVYDQINKDFLNNSEKYSEEARVNAGILKRAFGEKISEFKEANPTVEAFKSEGDTFDSSKLGNTEEFIANATRPTIAKTLGEIAELNSKIEQQSKADVEAMNNELTKQLKGTKVDAIEFANLSEEAQQNAYTISNIIDKLGNSNNTIIANITSKSGEIMDGIQIGDKYVVNPNSSNGVLNALMHEYTHGTESTKFYPLLKELSKQLWGEEFDQQVKFIKDEYSTIAQLTDEKAEREVVAHTIGQQLGNQEFVDRLVRYQTSLAYRMYEDIKMAVDNGGKILENIEYAFMKAFDELDKNTSVEDRIKDRKDISLNLSKGIELGTYNINNIDKVIDELTKDCKSLNEKGLLIGESFLELTENTDKKVNEYLYDKVNAYLSGIDDVNQYKNELASFENLVTNEQVNNLINNVHKTEATMHNENNNDIDMTNYLKFQLRNLNKRLAKLNELSSSNYDRTLVSQSDNTLEQQSFINHIGQIDYSIKNGGIYVYTTNEVGDLIDTGIYTEKNNLKEKYGSELANTMIANATNNKNQLFEKDIVKDFGILKNEDYINNCVKEAEETFGTTTNANEVGYIDINGKMLDFSGKRDGGEGNVRYIDHREMIGEWTDFIEMGNIRMFPETGGFEIIQSPNNKQIDALRYFLNNNTFSRKEGSFIGVSSNARNVGRYDVASFEFNVGTNADEIINKVINVIENKYNDADVKFSKGINVLNNISFSKGISLSDSNGKILSNSVKQYFDGTYVVDENNNLQVIYHTSNNLFSEFKPQGSNYKFGNKTVNYYTDNESMSRTYTNKDIINVDNKVIENGQADNGYLYDGYGKVLKPYQLQYNGKSWKNLNQGTFTMNESQVNLLKFAYDSAMKNGGNISNNLLNNTKGLAQELLIENPIILANLMNGNKFNMEQTSNGYRFQGELKTDDVVAAVLAINDYAQSKGYDNVYDGVIFDGIYDNSEYIGSKDPSRVVAMFDSNQFKLTSNENPSGSQDIRYSKGIQLSGLVDNKGKELTNSQVEFFKDSKARDDNGNLLKLYHGTNSAGFNEFVIQSSKGKGEGFTSNPYDIKGVWFTTSKRDADSYGGNDYKGGGNIYDPNEPKTIINQYKYDENKYKDFSFASKEMMDDFISKYDPNKDYMTPFEIKKNINDLENKYKNGEIDNEEYLRLIDELDDKKYDVQSFVDNYLNYLDKNMSNDDVVSIKEMIENKEKYDAFDFLSAIYQTFSDQTSMSLEEFGLDEERHNNWDDFKDTLIDNLLLNEEYEEDYEEDEKTLNYKVSLRARNNEDYQITKNNNVRTYEVYVNVVNPFVIDAEGRNVMPYNEIQNALESNDYDGVIVKNTKGIGRYKDLSDIVIATTPNQIKLTSNLYPTVNNDIRYSKGIELSGLKDSTGKELTTSQVDYFKDSKVRNNSGDLIQVYRGDVNEQPNTYKPNPFNKETDGLTQIKGYFTEDENFASNYGDVKPFYLNITNPLYFGNETKTLNDWKEWFSESGVDGIVFDSELTGENGSISTLKGYKDNGTYLYNAYELLDGTENWVGDGNLSQMIKDAGYDGMSWDYGEKAWIPLYSNQIKDINNQNPTNDNDIRFSKGIKLDVKDGIIDANVRAYRLLYVPKGSVLNVNVYQKIIRTEDKYDGSQITRISDNDLNEYFEEYDKSKINKFESIKLELKKDLELVKVSGRGRWYLTRNQRQINKAKSNSNLFESYVEEQVNKGYSSDDINNLKEEISDYIGKDNQWVENTQEVLNEVNYNSSDEWVTVSDIDDILNQRGISDKVTKRLEETKQTFIESVPKWVKGYDTIAAEYPQFSQDSLNNALYELLIYGDLKDETRTKLFNSLMSEVDYLSPENANGYTMKFNDDIDSFINEVLRTFSYEAKYKAGETDNKTVKRAMIMNQAYGGKSIETQYQAIKDGTSKQEISDKYKKDLQTKYQPITEKMLTNDRAIRETKGRASGRKVSQWQSIDQVNSTVAAGNVELHKMLQDNIRYGLLDPAAKVKYDKLNNSQSIIDKIKNLGIKEGSQEDIATQYYMEGHTEEYRDDIAKKGNITQDNLKELQNNPYMPYTLDDLKSQFNYKMGNGKYAWENIQDAAKILRDDYDNTYREVTTTQILANGDVEGNAQEELAKLKYNLEKEYGYLETIVNEIKNNGTTEARQTAYEIQKSKYNRLVNQYNELMNKHSKNDDTRRQLTPYRENYSHHIRKGSVKNSWESIKNAELLTPTELAGLSDYTKPNTAWSSFSAAQDGGKYDPTALGSYKAYMSEASDVIAYNPVIIELREFAKNIRSMAKGTELNTYVDYLNDYCNNLAGKRNNIDRGFQKIVGPRNMAIARSLNGYAKAAALAFNVRSALVQFANLPNGMAILNQKGGIKYGGDIAKGMVDYVNSMFTKESTAIDQSAFIGNRYFDFDTDEVGAKATIKGASDKLLQVGDKVAAQIIWWSAYEQANRLNKDVNPILYADDITRSAIAGRTKADQALATQSTTVNLLMPFQTENNNLYQTLKQMGAKGSANAILTYNMSAFIFNMIIKGITGGDDEVLAEFITPIYEEIKKAITEGQDVDTTVKNIFWGEIAETISFLPAGEQILNLTMNSDTAEKLFGDYSPSRYGSTNIGLSGIGKMIKAGTTSKSERQQFADALTEFIAGYITGGKQFTRTVGGLQSMGGLPKLAQDSDGENDELTSLANMFEISPVNYNSKGKVTWVNDQSNIGDWIKAGLFGKYNTSAAKEYYNGGSKTLSDTSTNIFNALNTIGGDTSGAGKTAKDYQNNNDKDGYSLRTTLKNEGKYDDYIAQVEKEYESYVKNFDTNSGKTMKTYTEFANGYGISSQDLKQDSYDSFYSSYKITDTKSKVIGDRTKYPNTKDSDGNTIANTGAALARQAYENAGIYDQLLDYIDKNGLSYEDFGLNKTIIGYNKQKMINVIKKANGGVYSGAGKVTTTTTNSSKKTTNSTKSSNAATKKKLQAYLTAYKTANTSVQSILKGMTTSSQAKKNVEAILKNAYKG